MKVLSLTQPWASLMAFDEKRVETRSWGTSYRGDIAIHAAKGFPKDAQETCNADPFAKVLRKHGILSHYQLPVGAVVCIVELVDVVRVEGEEPSARVVELLKANPLAHFELDFGNWAEGRYLWVTRNPRKVLPPFPHVGQQGLRDYVPAPQKESAK